MDKGISPLAHFTGPAKVQSKRVLEVWGVVVHTTGSTIVEQALHHEVDPLEYAVTYYEKPDSYSPHYCIGWDGTIVQITNEIERAEHVGITAAQREAYLDGRWKAMVPPQVAQLWDFKWGEKYKSPSHLYPGPSPNQAYVGIEMIPIVDDKACAYTGWKGGSFTGMQHESVGALCKDIATRWHFPAAWWITGRLVGHEDVQPITRPGWDPGALRQKPLFDWEMVHELLVPPKAPPQAVA